MDTSQEKLKSHWQKLWLNWSQDQAMGDQLWQELAKAYSGAGRHYHNLVHIADLLEQARQFQSEIENYQLLCLAIWYHDLIYNPLRQDNERRSAERAREVIAMIPLPEQDGQRVYQHILATKSHLSQTDQDTARLIDFDLRVLSWDWTDYLNYSKAIRKEYRLVPDFVYRRGRRKVLQHFLDQPTIYQSEAYQSQFEALAKQNLAQELDWIRQGKI